VVLRMSDVVRFNPMRSDAVIRATVHSVLALPWVPVSFIVLTLILQTQTLIDYVHCAWSKNNTEKFAPSFRSNVSVCVTSSVLPFLVFEFSNAQC